jgi:hypothetical protein
MQALQIDFAILSAAAHSTAISSALNITPDTALMQGERNAQNNLPRQNIWAFRTVSESGDLALHWGELENTLACRLTAIKQASQGGTVKITVIVRATARIPAIQIPPSISRIAGELNALIDIDIYQ